MSRIFKVRLWDQHGKSYLEHGFGSIYWDIGDIARTGWLAWPVNLMDELFTGLLDKNGKDIYEGDVILFYYGSKIPKYQVWWYRGKLQLHEIGGRLWDIDFGSESQMEIIGNIHENADLLEDDNATT